MYRTSLSVLGRLGLLALIGCARAPLPANSAPAKDAAELKTRYDALSLGLAEPEIAAFLGKSGALIAGYSSQVLKSKPAVGEAAVVASDSSKFWASEDWAGAIHVVFGSNGRAKLIQLLRITPTGPPPTPLGDPKNR